MGSGHALEAIRRLQNNRILKQEQRSKYEQMRTAVSKIKAKYHKFNDRNSLNEKELSTLKRKIKIQIIKQKQKKFIISSTISILIIAVIYFVSKYVYNYFLG
jgi:hypothetical protein